jgi:hypothetical protein
MKKTISPNRRKEDLKLDNMRKLQNTMRWAFVLITKMNVFVVVMAVIVFAAMMTHFSITNEGINIKDLGEFVYNYWFGFGIFHTGSLAAAGGAKVAQKFGEKKTAVIEEAKE